MRTGQRVVVQTLFGPQLGTVVDVPTEERTRVLVDMFAEPRVYENAEIATLTEAVESTITTLLRVLGAVGELDRPPVETQLRRLTSHADLIGFARALRADAS